MFLIKQWNAHNPSDIKQYWSMQDFKIKDKKSTKWYLSPAASQKLYFDSFHSLIHKVHLQHISESDQKIANPCTRLDVGIVAQLLLGNLYDYYFSGSFLDMSSVLAVA